MPGHSAERSPVLQPDRAGKCPVEPFRWFRERPTTCTSPSSSDTLSRRRQRRNQLREPARQRTCCVRAPRQTATVKAKALRVPSRPPVIPFVDARLPSRRDRGRPAPARRRARDTGEVGVTAFVPWTGRHGPAIRRRRQAPARSRRRAPREAQAHVQDERPGSASALSLTA